MLAAVAAFFAACPCMSARAATADADSRAKLAGAAFKPVPVRGGEVAPERARKGVLYAEQFISGRGLVRWQIPADATPEEAAFRPSPYVTLRDPEWAGIDDLVYITNWTEPFRAAGFEPDLAPSFAVLTGVDALATAVPVDGKRGRSVNPLRRVDAQEQRGRWFLFAAIRRRAIGFRFPDDQDGPNLALDKGGFVGRASAGLGWRRGTNQASIGYVYERVRFLRFGMKSRSDHRFGLTVLWRPEVDGRLPIRWR